MKEINLNAAKKQWSAVRKALVRLGGSVAELPPRCGLSDQVFSANIGVTNNKIFLKSNFKYPQRREEADIARHWFSKHKFTIRTIPSSIKFEGMGDVIYIDKHSVALGYGFRSSNAAKKYVESIGLSVPLHLRLVDPRFYHLDTCFVVMNGVVMYYPRAFDAASQKKIKHYFAHRIEVSQKDALGFVCNGVPLGKKYVTCRLSAPLRLQLKKYGIKAVELDMSEFLKSGGAVRCMVLNVNH